MKFFHFLKEKHHFFKIFAHFYNFSVEKSGSIDLAVANLLKYDQKPMEKSKSEVNHRWVRIS